MPDYNKQVDNLITKAKTGLKWTIFIKFTAQIFSWSITLIVVRYLTPLDFGLRAMSEIIFAFLILLASGGINSAIVQSKTLSQFQIRQVFTILLLLNLALCIIQNILSFQIAAYYNEQRLVSIIQTLSLGFLILPFISIHSAILSRKMEFKKNSLVMLTANVSGGICILFFAINGLGVWALIYGQLLILLLRAIGLIIVSGGLLKPTLNFSGASNLLKFGSAILSTTIIWYIFQKTDIIIGGRLLNTDIIGYYAVALHIASLPMDKIVPLLNQVAFPTYSRMQTDKESVRYYFLKSIRIISFIMLPVFFGLAIVSDIFVSLAFGEKWLEISFPLSVLCIVACMRTLNNLFSPAVNALGYPGVQFVNAIISLAIMAPSIYIGSQWELIGLCYAWLIGYLIIYVITSFRSSRILGIKYLTYLTPIIQVLLPAVLMCFFVIASKKLIFIDNTSWLSLITLIIIGASTYSILIYIFNRSIFYETMSVFKS